MAIGDVGSELGKSAPVQAVLVAWLPPVLLGMNVIAIGVLPEVESAPLVRHLRKGVDAMHVNKYVLLLVIAIALAAFMSLNRVFFYKVLEGDLWPSWFRRWRIDRAQVPQYQYVHARQQKNRAAQALKGAAEEHYRAQHDAAATGEQVTEAKDALQRAAQASTTADSAFQSAKASRARRGRLDPGPRGLGWVPRRPRPLLTPAEWTHPDDPDWIPTYPDQERQVMPTRVGNELRAMETYGYNTYGLDMQIFWYELYSLADLPLREAIDDNERSADTFVCSIFVTIALTIVSAWAAIWRTVNGNTSTQLWIVTALSFAALLPLHRGLIASVREWGATTQALINLGRLTLRERYGLAAPRDISDEREMWTALGGFVAYNSDPYYAAKLDKFRSRQRQVSERPPHKHRTSTG